jgi:hypothetical protein
LSSLSSAKIAHAKRHKFPPSVRRLRLPELLALFEQAGFAEVEFAPNRFRDRVVTRPPSPLPPF